MSQHIKSNTDLSNASNFDADAIGLMPDISHQESNATDESSAASVLIPNGMMNNGITLMGINHLQSSPLQGFINPNINAPKLDIPPSKVEIPSDVTPNGEEKSDKKQNVNDNNNNESGNNNENNNNELLPNKPPDLQLSLDEEKSGPHDPITPNTDVSYNRQQSHQSNFSSNISPHPQNNNNHIIPNMQNMQNMQNIQGIIYINLKIKCTTKID